MGEPDIDIDAILSGKAPPDLPENSVIVPARAEADALAAHYEREGWTVIRAGKRATDERS